MEIVKIVVGAYAANCYILYCKESLEGIVIDPGAQADDIIKVIEDRDISIKYIVLTHGHGDHIGGVEKLKNTFFIPVLAHKEEDIILTQSSKNLSYMMPGGKIEISSDKYIEEGYTIEFGLHRAEVIHTPGHSPGGICIKAGDYLFTGDTLFKRSIGRTDLYAGSYEVLISSIREKLLNLDDATIVLPGHGEESTIGSERLYNEFLIGRSL